MVILTRNSAHKVIESLVYSECLYFVLVSPLKLSMKLQISNKILELLIRLKKETKYKNI